MELIGQILEYFTYSPRDLLHFSPRTYFRLLAINNESVWPAPVVMLALGAAMVWIVARKGGAWRDRAAAAILAGAWLFVAQTYLRGQLATIHLAGTQFALAFVAQAALLLAFVVARRGEAAVAAGDLRRWGGVLIIVLALGIYPVIAPLCGRPWAQAEIFGIAPDPTVAATLGVLVGSGLRARTLAALLPLPLAWCAVTGVTLWTLDAPAFWLMPAIGLVAVGLAMMGRPRAAMAGSDASP